MIISNTPLSLTERLRSKSFRTFISALTAFFCYGLWAFYVNQSVSIELAVRAAAAQGGYSFMITYGLAHFMEWLFTHLPYSNSAKSSLCFGASATLLLTTSLLVHWLAGTPQPIATIAPSLTISIVYSAAYCAGLSKLARH